MSFRAKPTIEIDVPEPSKTWPEEPREEPKPEPEVVPEREPEAVPA